jgi:hypothetical protein
MSYKEMKEERDEKKTEWSKTTTELRKERYILLFLYIVEPPETLHNWVDSRWFPGTRIPS